jgi:hypothetical protein
VVCARDRARTEQFLGRPSTEVCHHGEVHDLEGGHDGHEDDHDDDHFHHGDQDDDQDGAASRMMETMERVNNKMQRKFEIIKRKDQHQGEVAVELDTLSAGSQS